VVPTDPAIKFNVQARGLDAVLAVRGCLDVATAVAFRERALQIVRARPVTLELDLWSVDFLDSSGLREICFVRNEGEARGVCVRIGCCSHAVLRILEVAGLREYLQGGPRRRLRVVAGEPRQPSGAA
jgi:anti-anti-sigma factor